MGADFLPDQHLAGSAGDTTQIAPQLRICGTCRHWDKALYRTDEWCGRCTIDWPQRWRPMHEARSCSDWQPSEGEGEGG
jgi:hypothetical protein